MSDGISPRDDASASAPGDDAAVDGEGRSGSSRLFDLRWLIAGMFVVYGAVLVVVGLFDSEAELAKASGVRINLWTGIGMVLIGLFFTAWARWRPLRREDVVVDDGDAPPDGER